MAHYGFRKRDLVMALSAAKRAGVPISRIEISGESGITLIVGEPELNEKAIMDQMERKTLWDNPLRK